MEFDTLTGIALIVLVLLVVLALVAFVQLMLQNGRVLVRLEELERRLDSVVEDRRHEALESAGSLPVGTHAPEFELPALDGQKHRLTDFLGTPVLLVFFDPESLECQALLPDLEHASRNRPRETFARFILVTTGDDASNRRLFDAFRLDALILIQQFDELSGFYFVNRAPCAYFIDSNNRTLSKRIDGAEAILSALAITNEQSSGSALEELSRSPGRTTPIPRGPAAQTPWLQTGDPAPRFSLESIDGGEVSLCGYSGRSLLLVFSDPVCQPCLEVVDELNRFLETHALHWEVLIVSRRSFSLNREVREHRGWRFPVALQHYWEVSDLYGLRRLPMACVIGPKGNMENPLLYGKENIWSLVKSRALA